MDFDKTTPRKEITVQKLTFSVIAPFAEGHPLTSNEANVLNQTFAENLRNNFASAVKKAIEEAGDAASVDTKALQKALDAYTAEYEFGVRRSGGGGGRIMDPVERKAMELARAKVRELLKAKGFKISSIKGGKITELAKGLLEKTPALTEEAKRQIEASQAIAADELGDLGDLGLETVESSDSAANESTNKKAKAA